MNQSQSFIFTRHNAVFLGICLSGLVLLVGISIIPFSSKQDFLEKEIASLTQELVRQRQNQTAITMVDSIVAKLDQQPTPKLVTPQPLPQNKTSQIDDDIRAIAHESSLVVSIVEPQFDSKNASWQTLTVQAELRGLFPNLRVFLLKILALPYVNQINRLEIHSEQSELRCNLTYTIDLA